MVKAPSQFPNAHAIAVRQTNARVLVHRNHPLPPCSWNTGQCTSLQEASWGWDRFQRGIWAQVGPFSAWITIDGFLPVQEPIHRCVEILSRSVGNVQFFGQGST